ncbi:MAG TPA: hypothetical protein VIT43_08425 [Candidatus Dormibacteraeota bacterium]
MTGSTKLGGINLYTYQHGIYPRSEKVVAATRGLDRGRNTQAEVDDAVHADQARWLQVQQTAGLDFLSDGLLGWQDIFRPLAETGGAKPHTLVRWFDTNTFFREPEFGSAPAPLSQVPLLAESNLDGGPSAPRASTFPSPYLFSRVAHTKLDRNELMLALARSLLRPAIDGAIRGGSKLIHLEEPWLGYYGIGQKDWAPLREALEILHRDLGATLVFHVYFGDAGPHLDQLRRLPVDAIGVDLTETDVGELGSDWDKALVAGVVDGRQSQLESLGSIVDVAQHLMQTVRPTALYLTSNCELAFLPTVVAERKVQRLGDAAKKLKELVSV